MSLYEYEFYDWDGIMYEELSFNKTVKHYLELIDQADDHGPILLAMLEYILKHWQVIENGEYRQFLQILDSRLDEWT